jgi:hypothetical protein
MVRARATDLAARTQPDSGKSISCWCLLPRRYRVGINGHQSETRVSLIDQHVRPPSQVKEGRKLVETRRSAGWSTVSVDVL